MIAVGAHRIVKSFGGRRILDGLELEVDERARIGIIGANGSGKSTLLRILAGLEDADDGEVARRKDAVIAYLPQQVPGAVLRGLDLAGEGTAQELVISPERDLFR